MEQRLEGKEDSMGFAKSKMKRNSACRRRKKSKTEAVVWTQHRLGCQLCVDSQQACSINWTLQNTQK